MFKTNKIKATLNNSNLSFKKLLIFFIVFALILNPSFAEDKDDVDKSTIDIILSPSGVKLGDPLSIKIKKIKGENSSPKIYFDKTKYPSFKISDEYFRALIPLTANHVAGNHSLEVFYGDTVKRQKVFINDKKFPLQELTLTKEVAALKASKIEKELVNEALSTVSSEKLWVGKFIFPSSGPQSTPYGVKRKINGILQTDYFHKGLDFAAKEGADIKAPEDGRIILIGQNSKGFVVNGNCIFIDHGQSVISGYLHLSKIFVKKGDLVKKGQLIGKVGSTGIASGPHLHWGIYVLGKTVDPIFWTSMIVE